MHTEQQPATAPSSGAAAQGGGMPPYTGSNGSSQGSHEAQPESGAMPQQGAPVYGAPTQGAPMYAAPAQGMQPGSAGTMGAQAPQAPESSQSQGHGHLVEHITGVPSDVGMMAADFANGGVPGSAYAQQLGPDMGQPHFSSQMPGAAPYQGAPVSGPVAFPGGGVPHPSAAMQPPQMPPPNGQQPGPVYPGGVAGPAYAPYPPPYQTAQPGQPYQAYQPYQPNPGAMPPPPFPGAPAADNKSQENRYGELYGLISEAANGNADVSSFMRFFQSTSSDFWKGALVGAGLALLLTNDTVKSAIAGSFAGLWGLVGNKAEEMEAEEDRKAEERAAKEKES